MPFVSISRPAIGISILKSVLEDRGDPLRSPVRESALRRVGGIRHLQRARRAGQRRAVRRRLAVRPASVRGRARPGGLRRDAPRERQSDRVRADHGRPAARRAVPAGVPRGIPHRRLRHRRVHDHVRAEPRVAGAVAADQGALARQGDRVRGRQLRGGDGAGAPQELSLDRLRLLGRGRAQLSTTGRRDRGRPRRRGHPGHRLPAGRPLHRQRPRRGDCRHGRRARRRTTTSTSPPSSAARWCRRCIRRCSSRPLEGAGGERRRTARSAG